MHKFILHKDGGKITNRIAFKEVFNSLEDGKYLIKVTSIRHRSLPQNSYYWGCVVPLVVDGLINAGYDEIKSNDDAHEVMKHLFLKKLMVSKKDGNMIEIAGSTKKLTTSEFNNYIEEIAKWCSEYLGFALPMPNEQIPMFNE